MEEITKKKPTRNKYYPEQLSSLYGKWIYPTMLMLLMYGWLVGKSRLFGGLTIIYGMRLILTRQKTVIRMSLVLGFISLCYFYEVEQTSQLTSLNSSITKKVITFPDTFSVKEHYISGVVQEVERPFRRSYIRGRVDDMTEKEQNDWRVRSQLLIVRGSEVFPSFPRNRDGYDARLYFHDLGISKILTIDNVKRLPQPRLSFWRASFREKRARLAWQAEQQFPKRTASYIKRLFLGIKDELYQQERDSYSETGLLHFFSISGLHVYFFLSIIHYVIRRMGGSPVLLLIIELLFLSSFILLTGESVSVIRASLFIVCHRINTFLGNKLTRLDSWCLTIFSVMIIRPYSLLTAGGQLTFYFTFILIYLRDIVSSTTNKWRKSVQTVFWMSLLSLPLTAYHFYQWSLLGTVLTLLISPFFGYVLLPILLLSWLVSAFVSLKGSVWLLMIDKLVTLLYQVISYVSQWPIVKVVTGKPPLFLIIAMLVYYFGFLGYTRRKASYYGVVLIMSMGLFVGLKYVNPFGTVAFVDVGQGDCLVIHPPFSAKATVIDTGGKLQFTNQKKKQVPQAKYQLLPFLKSRGVTQIETLFLTHADTDHIGDVKALSHVLPIEKVVFPKGMRKKSLGAKIIASLDSQTEIMEILSPQTIINHAGVFQVLSPAESGEGDNQHSLVLATTVGGRRLLLTGDLDVEGEERVMRRWQPTEFDILKVGHHGSRFSTSEQWLSYVSPKVAVISCGENNRYGHPHPEVLSELKNKNIQIFRTDQQGMIYYDYMTLFPYRTQIKTMIE